MDKDDDDEEDYEDDLTHAAHLMFIRSSAIKVTRHVLVLSIKHHHLTLGIPQHIGAETREEDAVGINKELLWASAFWNARNSTGTTLRHT